MHDWSLAPPRLPFTCTTRSARNSETCQIFAAAPFVRHALVAPPIHSLTFAPFSFAPPGVILVAITQCSLCGKEFTAVQWRAMALQVLGMVVVQYDPCRGPGGLRERGGGRPE